MMKSSSKRYTAEAIEVLSGLDPVKRRPGMYTDTSRPNHLAQEVIDNSVDEAVAGYAKRIDVILYPDNSLEVFDDGRGMPVDIHPGEKVTGVELILTRLHAGGKFNHKNYRYSGGLHGVGVSVVNALSRRLIVTIKRDGFIYQMQFEQGDKKSPLKKIGRADNKTVTGTALRFWPDKHYFDSEKFSLSHLKHSLRAKAVLCPGLHISFNDKQKHKREEWFYEEGVISYLKESLRQYDYLPKEPFHGHFSTENEEVDWALCWLLENGEGLMESYVNLIPTIQGGTHVNGLRSGLLEAMREFCELRDLLPRNLKLAPEDVWERCHYVLSVKLLEPQFSGQTKERLTSRQSASFVSNVIKDAFSLWLNQHITEAESLAELMIANAQKRLRSSKQVARKKIISGAVLPGKLADCTLTDLNRTELFLVEGDSAGGSAKQARDREFQAIMPLRGKILNSWEVASNQVISSQEIHDIAIAIGVDPGSVDLAGLRYGKICILADADSDGLHIATLLCGLFLKHFKPLVVEGHIYIAMPPLYRIDRGKEVYYALDDEEKQTVLDRLSLEKRKGKISVQRFKGLGEMNPPQLRETTMAPDTRRLVQLTIDGEKETISLMDMLLAKKRASDRKNWLEKKGNRATV
ncbi:MAG: DNA topoisomerase IV subunit B [Pseudomonadota bacterium]